jgi:hypothetical protein
MDIPDAPPAAKAFSHRHLDIPDAPMGDGPESVAPPPHGQTLCQAYGEKELKFE